MIATRAKGDALPTVEHEGQRYVLAMELVKAWGITRQAVYIAISQGRLPSIEVLGRRIIPEEAARNWEPISRGGARSGAGTKKRKGDNADSAK